MRNALFALYLFKLQLVQNDIDGIEIMCYNGFTENHKTGGIIMNKNIINILLVVVTVALLAAGLIFLAVSIFGETDKTSYLAAALVSIVLANLFNIFRRSFSKR